MGDEDAGALGMAGDDVAIGAAGFFAEPFDEGGGVGDFAFGFGEGFALFGGHDRGKVGLVFHKEIKPLAQDLRALVCQEAGPFGEGFGGGINGGAGFFGAHFGDGGEEGSGGRVLDVERLARGSGRPFAADESLGFQERGVLEFQGHGASPVRTYPTV